MLSIFSKLKAKTLTIDKLRPTQIEEMFQLYSSFYEETSFEIFRRDMLAKEKIILLMDRKKKLRGFSTLTRFNEVLEQKDIRVLYSGDTIIDPSYWGTAALTMEFLKNIILEKLLHPKTPVYWFLISKGYKTYLLLANNFINYYPRYDQPTPLEMKSLIERLSNSLFPGHFKSDNGILSFKGQNHEKLKSFVAPITEQMCEKYPKIKFFNEQNPFWQEGDELACIGEVSLKLALVHPYKVFRKKIIKMYQVIVPQTDAKAKG